MPDGAPIELAPEEIEVRLEAKEGYAAAASGAHVLVLDTRITDALRREGWAREVVNRIQRHRKDEDLAFDARIRLRYTADAELTRAIEEHADHIAGQTLAIALERGEGPADGRQETEVDGQAFAFWLDVATG
jgi:isoleucyl-tRNA synthetase